MRNLRVAALPVLVAFVLAPGASSRPDARVAASAMRASLTALPTDFVGAADCTTCGNCSVQDKHQISGSGPDRRYMEVDHTCSTSGWSDGKCADQHPESAGVCGSGGGDIPGGDSLFAAIPKLDNAAKERLWKLVVTEGAVDNLGAALTEFGPRVLYNSARHAIQVIGCGGSVALSIPLSAEQVAGLGL